MLKSNEWTFYVEDEDMITDGVYALSITDAVLDDDCWPVWCVVVRTGVVLQQHVMFPGEAYEMPEMVGMTVDEVAAWIREAEGMDAQQVSHNIMLMA
jgi:hypothetical protein